MSIFYEEEVDGDCYCDKCTKTGSVDKRDELYTNPSEYHQLSDLSGFGVYKEHTSIFHDKVITEAKMTEDDAKNALDEHKSELEYLVKTKSKNTDKIVNVIGCYITCVGVIDMGLNVAYGLPLGVIFSALEIIVGSTMSNAGKKGKLLKLKGKCTKTIKQCNKKKEKLSDKEADKYEKIISDLEKLKSEMDKEIDRL